MAAFLAEATTRPASTTAARYAERVPRASPRLASTREISRPLPPPPPPPPSSSPSRCTRPGRRDFTEQQVLPARCLRPAPKTSQPCRVNDVRPSWWKLPRGDATTSLERRSRDKRPTETPREREAWNSARVTASNANACLVVRPGDR